MTVLLHGSPTMKALALATSLLTAAVPAFASDDHLLDPDFGSGGLRAVPFDLSGGGRDRAVKVLRRSDGSYFVVGTASAPGGQHLAVTRLTAAGNLDGSFGTGGRVTLDPCVDEVTDAALDSSGRLLVLGNTTACGTAGTPDGRLLRLTASGALDTSFASGGIRNIRFTTVTDAHEKAFALILRSNGEILVGGGVDNDGPATVFVEKSAFLRVHPDGFDLGTVPGASGSVGERIVAGSALADGSVVWLIRRYANLASTAGAFWRLTPALVSDDSFGTLGRKPIQSAGPETGCGAAFDHVPTAIVPMQGTFKAFGWAIVGSVARSWYASVNDTVGGTGFRVRCLTDVLPGEISVLAAAHHPVGGPNEIVLAAICGDLPYHQCVLRARLVNPAVPELLELDPGFNGGLPRIIEYPAQISNTPAGGGVSILRQANGRTVVAGWRRWNMSDDDFAIARLGRDPLLVDGFEAP